MKLSDAEKRFVEAGALVSGFSLILFFARLAITGTPRYWFVPQNLLLAWLALLFAWLLSRWLSKNHWRSWQGLVLTILWLTFLPNTWYVMTDFIHIVVTGEISQLYDIVLFNSLVAFGLTAGFTSLFLVHKQLLKRVSAATAAWLVTLVILLASFAIYLGRDLRWNTWDILANPGGLVLNVSDRLTDPFGRPRMFNVTGLFFLAIGAGYAAVWRIGRPRN